MPEAGNYSDVFPGKAGTGISGSNRGYLKGDFEFFHLKDRKSIQFEYHYHDFDKIIVFISGRVTYLIEGKAYRLKPWDILLVSSREVHKPVIDPDVEYERIVIWANDGFLARHSSEDCNPSACFELALHEKFNLLRAEPGVVKNMRSILYQLEDAVKSNGFGSRILKNSLFMQFIVHLNRAFLGSGKTWEPGDIDYDEAIGAILEYINGHLGEDLSVDSLSAMFYMSGFHLMHKFKARTGYSVHGYILQKRLIAAGLLIKKGKPVMEAGIECGFNDYSNFSRAFKRMFGLSPKKYYKSLQALKENEGERHFSS